MLENNLNYIINWFGRRPGLGVNSSLIFLCVKEKKPYVKNFRNIDFLPVKIKIHAWKNPKMCPWNILTTREKLQKSVRESDFLCVKKIKKRPKIRFTHTFDFHGKKKKAAPLNLRSYFPVPKYLVLLVFVCVICICDFRAWGESTFFICLARRGVVQGLKLSPR